MKAAAAKSVRVGVFTTLQRPDCRDASPALKHMLDSYGYDGFGRSAFEEDATRQALRRVELEPYGRFWSYLFWPSAKTI
jgi:hypothetical protein